MRRLTIRRWNLDQQYRGGPLWLWSLMAGITSCSYSIEWEDWEAQIKLDAEILAYWENKC